MLGYTENIAETVAKLANPVPATSQCEGGIPHLVMRGSDKVVGLEEYLENPTRVREAVMVSDPESLDQYVTKYANKDSLIKVNAKQFFIKCYIDYHGVGKPHWQDHSIQLTAKESEKFEKWKGLAKKPVDQLEFCDFIEDNLADIVSPDAATLLEMARHINIVKNTSYSGKVSQDGGFTKVDVLSEEGAKIGGNVEIPNDMTINVPVFENSFYVKIKVRLRVRIAEGKLSIGVRLVGADEIKAQEFKVIKSMALAKATELKLLTLNV